MNTATIHSGYYSGGTVVILQGDTPEGRPVTIATDHRVGIDLLMAAAEGGVEVEYEDWQVLG